MTIELYDSHRDYSAPAGARLTYRGGPLITSPKLFGVFFDDFPFKAEMSAYLDWFAQSDVLGELREYNVSGSGSHIGDASLSLNGPSPVPPPPPPPPPVPHPHPRPAPCPPGCQPIPHGRKKHHAAELLSYLRLKSFARGIGALRTVQDGDLQNVLASAIHAGSVPAPDASTLYVLFLPSGVVVDMGGDASCTTFCGYHSTFSMGGQDVFYAVLPFPDCDGCLGGLSALDALTGTTSHELCEAVTDPVPGQGWYDDANGEIGDICAWQFRKDGQYNVQLEWSNKARACI